MRSGLSRIYCRCSYGCIRFRHALPSRGRLRDRLAWPPLCVSEVRHKLIQEHGDVAGDVKLEFKVLDENSVVLLARLPDIRIAESLVSELSLSWTVQQTPMKPLDNKACPRVLLHV